MIGNKSCMLSIKVENRIPAQTDLINECLLNNGETKKPKGTNIKRFIKVLDLLVRLISKSNFFLILTSLNQEIDIVFPSLILENTPTQIIIEYRIVKIRNTILTDLLFFEHRKNTIGNIANNKLKSDKSNL